MGRMVSGLGLLCFLYVPVFAYTDVTDQDEYVVAIKSLSEQGLFVGYEDGSFRPDQKITRAEVLKLLLVLEWGSIIDVPVNSCFSDVDLETWYTPYICFAKIDGVVQGYADGTFAPTQNVTLVEAAKLIVTVLDLPLLDSGHEEWYVPYLSVLEHRKALPLSLEYLTETLTREEFAEMLWRVVEGVEDQPSLVVSQLSAAVCEEFIPDIPPSVDLEKVKDAWFSWVNDARAQAGLSAYGGSFQLDRTAYEWSVYSAERGYIDHKRPGTSAYYDYRAIEGWFEDLGVTFENHGGYTFTENIGRGPYSCFESDCTQEVIDMIRYTFDYFMSEKYSSYRPHYNSIMNGQFKKMGFGIVLPEGGGYYFTVHYGTAVDSSVVLCDE